MEDTGVVNAPTRPPGPRSLRRSPRGPRTVALNPEDQRRRDQLVTAANTLRESGKPDLADAVDYVLTPAGQKFIGRLHYQKLSETADPPLSIGMTVSRKTQVKQAAAAAGDTLTSVLDDGFRRFLAGEFEFRRERAAHGKAESRATLNTRPDGVLQGEVARRCRELKEASGAVGLGLSPVAAAILYERYGLGPYAPDSDNSGSV